MRRIHINQNLYTPIAIVISGIIIAGAIVGVSLKGSGGTLADSNPTPSTGAATAVVDASQVNATGEPYIGSANAPLTIAYWFDYQCPFCKQNEEVVMPSLVSDYVASGKVRIIFKDFSFLGADSDTLGHAARAVWQVAPNQFYAWHTAMYNAQGEENTGWATMAKIEQVTATVLSPAQTTQVMQLMVSNAKTYQAEMDADKQEGEKDGVQGTPALLIGSQMVDGSEPYAQVKAVIDAQLAAKK